MKIEAGTTEEDVETRHAVNNMLPFAEARIKIYCNGYNRPGSGIATWGWIAFDANERVVESGMGCAGRGKGLSHHLATYHATLEALRWVQFHAGDKVTEIYVDSDFVVGQINGLTRCNRKTLRPLRNEAATLLATIKATIKRISRPANRIARALARKAYRDVLAKNDVQ
jgi:ribonuclease HI